MKTNKMMRIASVMLIAVLLSTCVISGTFAKYTTTATSEEATARVAKWDIKFGSGDNETTLTNNFEFNLFETINDSNGTDVETDVKDGGDTVNIIAPGTSGSFEIVLTNKSEVTAAYAIDYTVTNTNNIPVVFSVDGTNWGELSNVAKDIETETSAETTILTMENGTKTIKVQWKWLYEQTDITAGDTADNALSAGTAELKVKAAVTVTQVD